MTKKRNKLTNNKFFIYGTLSLFIHSILLFIFLPDKRINNKVIKPSRNFSIKLSKKRKKIVKKKKIDTKNKQIVDIKKPNFQTQPKKAKYLAKYDSKTKKELKAKKKNNIIKKIVDKNDTPVYKRNMNKIIKEKIIKKENNKRETKKTKNNINFDKKTKNKKILEKKKNGKKSKNLKLKFSDLQFSKILNSASNDYLKDIKEGDYTSLNTLAYEYTGYFIKIKNKVSQNWNPAAVYQKYDPYRKIYGIKDRYTILLITIDKNGYLKKIKIQKSSGLSFLDKEAIRAFEVGQPYKIVPDGLLNKKDSFTIQFGFYVDNPSSPRVFYFR